MPRLLCAQVLPAGLKGYLDRHAYVITLCKHTWVGTATHQEVLQLSQRPTWVGAGDPKERPARRALTMPVLPQGPLAGPPWVEGALPC